MEQQPQVLRVRVLDKHRVDVTVLKAVDLTLKKDEQVCVIGASGAERAPMRPCCDRAEVPISGQIYIHGSRIAHKASRSCDPYCRRLSSNRAGQSRIWRSETRTAHSFAAAHRGLTIENSRHRKV
ncbi:ABC transporter [Ketogulonicigenium vulgare]|uniref:ABC transporter n=1 Tax=Ketogulonicigenium vulgare TaxID=92945 RepID=UPI0023596BE2|nr:ABC transporter [Ketogulonicigenium vulgare]